MGSRRGADNLPAMSPSAPKKSASPTTRAYSCAAELLACWSYFQVCCCRCYRGGGVECRVGGGGNGQRGENNQDIRPVRHSSGLGTCLSQCELRNVDYRLSCDELACAMKTLRCFCFVSVQKEQGEGAKKRRYSRTRVLDLTRRVCRRDLFVKGRRDLKALVAWPSLALGIFSSLE